MGALYSSLRNCLKKWKYRDNSAASPAEAEEMSDLFFELRILQVATNFFSDMNLLGHGGFGPVFKVLLIPYYSYLINSFFLLIVPHFPCTSSIHFLLKSFHGIW